MNQGLTVLFAEDSAPDRLILQSIITNAGYTAVPAENGLAAIEAFDMHKPDIVLLDVLMPTMGGVEAARILREKDSDEFVPILFLTSLSDTDSLVECIEAGGNDFIPKPFNQTVLLSKIGSFARIREMHSTLSKQKEQIERNNMHLIQEQTVAKQVFDQIAHTGCLDEGYLRYHMSPFAVFNGDVVVADISPTGSMMVLLGDFTGHGLPAAIGSMPLATTFYGMVRKGFSVSDIMREINQKLYDILPVGFFCCATCLDISIKDRRIRYWSGGLPAAMLYRSQEDRFIPLESQNLPLGILSAKDFKDDTERVFLDFGDSVFLWSDGVYEARNPQGQMFGEDNLHSLLEQKKGSPDLFDEILRAVHGHVGEGEKDDDLSLVEIPFIDVEYKSKHSEVAKAAQKKLVDWNMSLCLEASSLKHFDPLPLISNILDEVQGLWPHRTLLYTVIAELYSNALEHGLLGLDSQLKKTPTGFAEYYQTRSDKLDALEKGSIRFDIRHRAEGEGTDAGGTLWIRIVDTGPGFGVEKDVTELNTNKDEVGEAEPVEQFKSRYFGRGLTLLKSVCRSVTIRAPGNDVEIAFAWHSSDK